MLFWLIQIFLVFQYWRLSVFFSISPFFSASRSTFFTAWKVVTTSGSRCKTPIFWFPGVVYCTEFRCLVGENQIAVEKTNHSVRENQVHNRERFFERTSKEVWRQFLPSMAIMIFGKDPKIGTPPSHAQEIVNAIGSLFVAPVESHHVSRWILQNILPKWLMTFHDFSVCGPWNHWTKKWLLPTKLFCMQEQQFLPCHLSLQNFQSFSNLSRSSHHARRFADAKTRNKKQKQMRVCCSTPDMLSKHSDVKCDATRKIGLHQEFPSFRVFHGC